MFDALYISATGMQAQQLNVDTIANNLTNVNTERFKKGHVSFTDLMMQETARIQSSSQNADGNGEIGPLAQVPHFGAGVGVASVGKSFELGDMKQTDSPFDVAIQGDGFFELVMPDGSRAFTRGGTLKVNADGMLSTLSGLPLKPNITVPTNATNIEISKDGHIKITVPNQTQPIDAGQLEMVRFTNPTGLIAEGDDRYRASDASGEPITGKAGQEGIGLLAQGFQEGSNVKMVDEMVNLMVAQHAYQASVKVAQASDEMLGMINNLRK